jgi:hypothetical protein
MSLFSIYERGLIMTNKFEVAKNLHPAIGALMTAKGVKYYAYINGVYTEGTIDQLTGKLRG